MRASAHAGQTAALRALAGDPAYVTALAAALPAVAVLAWLVGAGLRPHPPAPVAAATLIVAAPILEEIVFRAGLQDWLEARWPGRRGALSAANAITAVVFALAHLLAHPPAWAAATTLPALAFGYFYERHGRRLAAPIGLHAFYNAAYLVFLG